VYFRRGTLSAFPSERKYRVVGIRTDKTRVTLAEGLTRDQAIAVVKDLTEPRAFVSVAVEPESEHAIPTPE
jgi:hypothetical protein